MLRKFLLIIATVAFAIVSVTDAFATEDGSLHATLDWMNMRIDVSVELGLKNLGVTLPTGRSQAEVSLYTEYFSKIEDFVYSIPVDSSSVMGDFLERGQLTPEAVDELVLAASSVPPAISADMQKIKGSYIISLNDVASKLVTHSSGANFMHIINPPPAASYTGLIIIADGELPVHGRRNSAKLIPCLFPKIWDSEMNLIYDKKFANPEIFTNATLVNYASREGIFARNPSGLSPEITKLVGERPLRVIARGSFGIRPTDVIIDTEDALILLASEENKRLLRDGKVVFVVSPELTKAEFSR
jgi:hypothetical protein